MTTPNENLSKHDPGITLEMNTIEQNMSDDDCRIIPDLSPDITITFHNVSKVLNVPGKMVDPDSKEKTVQRTLLDQISGQVHAGSLVALMGPSGSGKTTLLNVLAGRTLSGVTGNIWMNNQRFDKSMKRKLAYVLQEDIFFENLTVKRQLIYTALLRLPNTVTRKDKLAQVNDIIQQLRLEKCANTPIFLVSGGEKKRVNIATELLTNPSVIFLDEPTSGLDSTSALSLINILQELASNGKTIITSIHQPSSQIFQSFDQLIILADGKTIFMGKPSNALNYFDTLGYHCPLQYNAADFIMDLVNRDKEIREKLKEAYVLNKYSSNENILLEGSCQGRQYLIAEPSGSQADLPIGNSLNNLQQNDENKWPIGFIAQTSILYQRNWILTSKSQFSKLNLIQAILLSLLYGLFWLRMPYNEQTLNDRSSLIYSLFMFWPLEVCYTTVLSFQLERLIIEKERASGSYRLSAYYFAKCFSETPIKLVLPLLSATFVYWMANMNPNFGIFLAILCFTLMTILVTESIAILIASLSQDIRKSVVATNVILYGLLFVGGYFIQNIPYWLKVWINWFSFYRYSYNAALRLQFMGGKLYQCVDGTRIDVCKNNINGTFTGADALEYFKPDLSIGVNFLILFGMVITLRVAAYLALRFIKRKSGRI